MPHNRIIVVQAIALMAIQVFLMTPLVLGGEFNRMLSPGDACPTWSNLIGTDDKEHSLEELAEAKVLVVVFTCNSCPYAVDVEDRMLELDRVYRDRNVHVVAVNVNTGDEDSLDTMKARAKEKDFGFAYLYDPTQKIAKDFGATRTPEFFVFDSQRHLVYQGSMDDSPDGKSVANRYVELAIQATLDSKVVAVKETVPIGCGIRFERTRRTRATSK
jgi:peroxiredoxin